LFWNFAVSHVGFLLNRLPSKGLHNKSLYDILYDSSSDLTFIKIFGCEAFASTLTHNRTKLDPRARWCVYLGHRRGIKGSLLYDSHTREVFLSRNVSFNENSFPFKHIINHTYSENFVMPHFLIIKTLISLFLDPPHHYKTNKYHILFHNKIIPLPLHHYKINKHHILSHKKILPLPLS